jgi:hypothetical protein
MANARTTGTAKKNFQATAELARDANPREAMMGRSPVGSLFDSVASCQSTAACASTQKVMATPNPK